MSYDLTRIQRVAPGPWPGGSCLPKDTRALVRICEDAGHDFVLLRSVIAADTEQQKRVASKVATTAGGLWSATVAVWGLTFKAGTGDRRDSTAAAIAENRSRAGASVRAYDPTVRQPLPGLEVCLEPYGARRERRSSSW